MYYKISDNDSKIINIVKAIGIILVIYIHVNDSEVPNIWGDFSLSFSCFALLLKYIISRVIARVAVPSMFLVSALLLYWKPIDYKQNLLKKINSLLIPYTIINTGWICAFFLAQQIPVLSGFFSNSQYYVSEWNLSQWADALWGVTGEPLVYPLWFVRDLFFLNILSVLLKNIIDKFPKAILIILLFAWIINVDTKVFFCSIQSLCFWCLGYYIIKYNLHFEGLKRINFYKPLAIFLIFTVLDCLSLKRGYYYVIIHQVCILIGVVLLLKIACMLSIRKNIILAPVIRYGFGIYLFHELFLSTIKKILNRFIDDNMFPGLVVYFVLPIFVLLICIQICRLLEKISPTLYAIIVGGRTKCCREHK